jgi:hypothetical protein
MPQTVGANVARAARIADAYAAAETNRIGTVKMTATAKWHQDQSVRTLSNSLGRQRDKIACVPPARAPSPRPNLENATTLKKHKTLPVAGMVQEPRLPLNGDRIVRKPQCHGPVVSPQAPAAPKNPQTEKCSWSVRERISLVLEVPEDRPRKLFKNSTPERNVRCRRQRM